MQKMFLLISVFILCFLANSSTHDTVVWVLLPKRESVVVTEHRCKEMRGIYLVIQQLSRITSLLSTQIQPPTIDLRKTRVPYMIHGVLPPHLVDQPGGGHLEKSSVDSHQQGLMKGTSPNSDSRAQYISLWVNLPDGHCAPYLWNVLIPSTVASCGLEGMGHNWGSYGSYWSSEH